MLRISYSLTMSNLPGLETFVHLARSGSISATARTLGVPRSTVTRRLARLADPSQARLLQPQFHVVLLWKCALCDMRVVFGK